MKHSFQEYDIGEEFFVMTFCQLELNIQMPGTSFISYKYRLHDAKQTTAPCLNPDSS